MSVVAGLVTPLGCEELPEGPIGPQGNPGSDF